VTLLAHLLLATVLFAQDKPWEDETVTVEALKAASKTVKAEIQPLPEKPTPEQKAWDAAHRKRHGLLEEFIQVATAIDEMSDSKDAEGQANEWVRKTTALREAKPDPTPAIKGAEDLKPLTEKNRAASAAVSDIEERLKRLKTISSEAEKRLQSMPTRRAQLQESANKIGEPKAGSIEAYRLGNIQLELRLLKDLEDGSSGLRTQVTDERKIRTAELDHGKLVARRAGELLNAGRKALEEASAADAERLKKEKERAEAEARQAKDPVHKFRAALQVRIAALDEALKKDESTQSQLDRRITTEKALLEQYKKRYKRLSDRIERSESVSSAAAKQLHDELLTVDRREESVRRVALPGVLREISTVERELIAVQDDEWDLELAPEDTQIWTTWIAPLPEDRLQEGVAAFDELAVGADGLRTRLRARIASLSKSHRAWTVLESNYEAQLDSLANIETLIRGRIYWVRTEPRLGVDLIANVRKELGHAADFYAETEFVAEIGATFEAQPGLIIGGFLLLILLLAGSTVAARKLKSHRMNRPTEGHRMRTGIADAARMLFHAAVPSLVLLGGAALVRRMDMPERLAFPLLTVFDGIAVLLFLQRLAWGLLNERGFLVNHFGIEPDVGRQSLRSVRILTMSAMLFHVPELILAEAPFEVSSLHRLFGTAFRGSQLLALALLLPRRQPVAKAFVGGSEAGARLAGVVSPMFLIVLASIFVMDFLGYRYGAIFFTDRAVEFVLTVLILRGVYSGLNQISDRVVARVRERAYSERGSKAAWEDSEKVAPQLSRIITVVTLVAAAIFLGGSWELGSSFGALLSEWHLFELAGEDNFISVADILKAFLWVIGVHFFASNLAGIFELLIFPVFGNIHRGTRYVVLALSRYVILLIGYSAALISLHFSLQSVGWLLTAASVGLGFGLQEIVANFISGLILLVEQPARVGDVITVGESGGTVEKIAIRATIVTNWDQQQIIIPNKAFITQNLTNWTRNNNFTRKKISLRLAYGTDLEKAIATLEKTVKEQENVRSYPPPRIWFNGFGDSGLEIECWIYVDIEFGISTASNVRRAILKALVDAGIRIPVPQRDIHLVDARDSDPMTDLQGAAGTLENAGDAPAEPEEDDS